MRYRAVIFDLFGTLVGSFSVRESEDTITRMASALRAPREDFARLWKDGTWLDRATGRFSSVESNLRHICDVLGLEVHDNQIREAAIFRIDFTRSSLTPKVDALETLARLKETGHRLGLISDCSVEVPDLWPQTPMAPLVDVPVFSCTVGIMKPDPMIYRLACEQLAVSPHDCLYVGDGNSRELTGALALGMDAVLVKVPLEDTYEPHRPEVAEWTGPAVTTLTEIAALVGV